jgi:endonuclease/exonuclease/phosphatase (EEP) superfamily protein YafD
VTSRRAQGHRLLTAAAWGLVVPSGVIAAGRGVRHQRHASVLMVEALGPVWAVPSLAAAALGAALRRPGLGAVGAALAGLHLAWLRPEIRRRPRPHTSPPARRAGVGDPARLRLFSQNLLFTNTRMEGVAAEVVAADPDVVVLQEVSRPNLAALERTGLVDRYPHRWLDPRTDALGTAILSRHRLEEAGRWWCAGLVMARATVVVGDRRLALYDVHTRAPIGPGAPAHWEEQLATLAHVASSEPGPLVLAGDFNASSGHRAFRELLAAGLVDAHVAAGRWWATTWPCDLRPLPSLSRIDHVLVSPHLEVLNVRPADGRSSDHRPGVVDLALADDGPERTRSP